MAKKISIEDINRIVNENKEFCVDFLQKVVQIPSVTGEEKQVSDYIKNWIEKHIEIPVNVYEKIPERPNLIASWDGNQDGESFLFNGHYDVFPPIPDDPGLFGPWSGHIENGYLYGRGSVDMKGGLCASILAVYFMKKLGFIPNGKVILSCDADEENGGANGVDYLLDEGLLNADYGICVEPSHNKILVVGSGGVWAEVTCFAEPLHGSIPEKNPDAIQRALKAINKLVEFDKRIQKERYYAPYGSGPTLSVTMIEGGEAENMHPSKCSFTIDRRLVPGESVEQAEQEIIDIMESLKKEDPLAEYTYQRIHYCPQYVVDKEHKLIRESLKAYEEIAGHKTETFERSGGSDAHKIVERLGICMPNFGPGDELAETTMPNEKILLNDFLDFIKIYMRIVMSLLEE